MPESDLLPRQTVKGRGAIGRDASRRFGDWIRAAVDDGWDAPETDGREATQVQNEQARRIITYNESPDIGFDRSINPYRGCEHGCIYCYARPSHAWLGLSPGLDFETKLFAKENAPELLRRELRSKNYRVAPIMLGANTDPYQPIERSRGLTREILGILAQSRHPVMIVTKSALILRDLDLLAEMARHNLVRVMISVTTLEGELARVMEPRASIPARRLATIGSLARAEIPVGVLAAPMIPALNDFELEAILAASRKEGAIFASYVLLRLPFELKDLFRDWLDAHFPDRTERIFSQLRAMYGPDLYDSRFGVRGSGKGPYAALLRSRFALAVRRHGYHHHADTRLEVEAFRPPPADTGQGELFGEDHFPDFS